MLHNVMEIIREIILLYNIMEIRVKLYYDVINSNENSVIIYWKKLN